MDFPQIPNPHALAMLLMTGVALFLFTREKIRLESSSLAILVIVVTGFEIFPFEGPRGVIEPMAFFHGFGQQGIRRFMREIFFAGVEPNERPPLLRGRG